MLSIIIPAYNEESRIKPTLEAYLEFFKDKDIEIIIVMNGCTDNTLKVVESIKDQRLKYLNLKQVGKGNALLQGFKIASGDLVSYVDADNSTTPEFLNKLLENIEDFDCVMGSRYLEGSRILTKQPVLRRVLSRGFNLMVRLILNLQYTDTQAGAKIFKKDALQDLLSDFNVPGWGFDVNILYKIRKKGYTIKETPIEWSDIKGSKLKLRKAIPGMFFSVLKTRFGK